MRLHNVAALLGTLSITIPAPATPQTLRGYTATGIDTTRVSIFADGNIRALATGAKENAAGTGSLGILVEDSKVQWSGSVNIASTVDTLRQRAGVAILSPASGKGLQSGLIELRAQDFLVFRNPYGLHAYMSASKSIWARDTATAVEAVVVGIGLTGYRDLVNGAIGDNRVALTLELGLSYRSLIGDVAGRDSLREALLGTRSSTFYGFEGGMQIRFNKIVAGVQLYHLWDLTRGKRVDGLTRGQMVAGFSVQGDVFTGTLTGRRNPS